MSFYLKNTISLVLGRRFGVRFVEKKGIFICFFVSISLLLDALFLSNCYSCISSMGTLQLNVGNFVVVEHSHVGVSFENGFEAFAAMKIHIVAVLVIILCCLFP